MKVTNGQVTEWTDASGKGNHALHDAFGAGIPSVSVANGKPTLKFSGGYTGFHFPQIATIRTLFVVLSKDRDSCLPTLPNYGTAAKFWLGGKDAQTYFHPEHGCSIWNGNLSEVSPSLVNGKTYVNGKLGDGRKTFFPFELGLVSVVSTANVVADTIARDRTFQDRSWQGNISELLIYSKPLDDATRVAIENNLSTKYAIGMAAGGAPGGGGGAGGAAGASNTGGTGGSAAAGGVTAVAGGAAIGGAGGAAAGQNSGGAAVAGGETGLGGNLSAGGAPVAAAGRPPTPATDDGGCSVTRAQAAAPGAMPLFLLLGLSIVWSARRRPRRR